MTKDGDEVVTQETLSSPTAEPFRLDWDFVQDPLATYAVLRARGRVHHVELPTGLRAWLVTDYDLGEELLSDVRLRKAREARAQALSRHGADRSGVGHMEALNSHLLASDPPDHTRLRRLVNQAFTARRVAAMHPQVERRVSSLLDGLETGVELDLLERFAFPLAIGVLGDLLGVPEQDLLALRGWIDDLYDGGRAPGPRREAAEQFLAYLRDLLGRHRAAPEGGLVGDLVRARDGSDRLSEDELVSLVGLLLTAGFETTAGLIGSGIFLLLQQSDQVAALREDPALVPAAVEVLLRLCSPVHLSTPRFTAVAITVDDVVIPAGEIVQVSLLAANHDPARYAAPDAVDLGQTAGSHLAFGHGIHFCLGAPLARLQANEALLGLSTRFSAIRLTGDPADLRWRRSVVIRGLESLPVRLTAVR